MLLTEEQKNKGLNKIKDRCERRIKYIKNNSNNHNKEMEICEQLLMIKSVNRMLLE